MGAVVAVGFVDMVVTVGIVDTVGIVVGAMVAVGFVGAVVTVGIVAAAVSVGAVVLSVPIVLLMLSVGTGLSSVGKVLVDGVVAFTVGAEVGICVATVPVGTVPSAGGVSFVSRRAAPRTTSSITPQSIHTICFFIGSVPFAFSRILYHFFFCVSR